MNIQHEIISFNPATGSILVRYYCDEFLEGLAYNIDLPIVNGQIIPQNEVDDYISNFKPTGQLERILQLKTVEIPEYLSEKIPVPVVYQPPTVDQPTIVGVDQLPQGQI